MTRLRSIVYVSSAAQPLSEGDLEWLLVEARRLNGETQTTGVLLYGGGNFMQCFEGPEESIPVTYGRIRASRRHQGLIELLDEPIAARSFEHWNLGFKQAAEADLLALSTHDWERQAEAPADGASSGMHLLKAFWRQRS